VTGSSPVIGSTQHKNRTVPGRLTTRRNQSVDEMTSLFDSVRDELRALTGDVLALAVRVPFRRIRDGDGRLVTALDPTEEQRMIATKHHQRLRDWSRMVASILRRRGRSDPSAIVQCVADFEPYILLSRTDVAGVTESTWRTAFAKEVTRLSLDAERVLEEDPDAFTVTRRRPALLYNDFDVQLSEIDLVAFDRAASTRALASGDIEAIGCIGQALFRVVFARSIGQSYAECRKASAQLGRGLRIRLHLDRGGYLGGFPWELLHDGQQFLSLSGETPIVRCIEGIGSARQLPAAPPLRILVTISSPRSFPLLDVEAERERLVAAIAPLVMLGLVKIDVAPDGSMNTLRRMLRSADEIGRPYQVWHFIGHGRYDEQTTRGDLVMSGEGNQPQYAGGWELGPLFKAHRDLRFACLNACKGARWEAGIPVSGAATSLIEAGVPAVTAMQFVISDAAAIAFAEELYGALADGAALEDAVAEARRGIFFQPNPTEWITPVLFVPWRDGVNELLTLSGQTRE
jgi:hypothetical protein